MQLLGYDDEDRPFVSLRVAAVALVAALVLGAGLAYLLSGGRSQAPEGARPATSQEPRCADAVREADAVLALAREVDGALAEHTAIVDDLMAGRITSDQAVERAMPVLTRGSQRSLDLDVAGQRYEAVADACRP